jgi:hypothetical protein
MQASLERWAQRLKLNPDSETTKQLYENRHMSVEAYVGRFRRGRLNEVLPAEALQMTVEEALRQQVVGGRNLRKLLASTREKFQK